MGSAKRIEISLIALGIAATAVIGYGQWNLGKQQNRQTELYAKATEKRELSIAKQAAELQIIELVHPHLEKFAACEPSGASQQMVSVSSTYLNSRHKSTVVADMAEELARECDDAIAQNTRTRIAEATVVIEEHKAIKNNKWFTVVATYDINRESDAKAAVVDLQKKVDAAAVEAQVNIYRTKISNSYALVIGGPLSEKQAVDLARIARTRGIAEDAFAQIDKEWVAQTL